MNITIVGTGYVGLSTGAMLAYLGYQVTCIDIDEERLATLRRGCLGTRADEYLWQSPGVLPLTGTLPAPHKSL